MASLNDYIQEVSDPATRRALGVLFESIRTDLNAIVTAITGVTAQLDADETVTDTDYAANNDPSLTLTE